ncbi:uncharacterized protein LOC116234676 [Phasianus colchicus]|uniref:uncharacterized protein LOC116234676 n=1 Tax=Phasianus colchicus TaxID=9054 RepID=UPI00129EBC1C|nr:uncharacterized protein LOC116234676 [Phasianus colchicus]
MKITVTLSLTVALSIVSFLRDGLGRFSSRGQVSDSEKKLALPEKQLPTDTQHEASNLPCWLGLSACPRRVRYRLSRVVSAEVPNQQTKGMEQEAFKGSWWSGLSVYATRVWKSVSKMVLPQEQQPVYTEHEASNWPCRLGLSTCPRRVRYRVSRVIVTEGLKQEPLGMGKKSFSLPYPLDHLWGYIAQGALASLIMEGLLIIFIQYLLRIAHGSWS